MIELYRGSINTWECDEMGHMNVRFYVAKAMEGLAELAHSVGLGHAFRANAQSTLRPRDQHIRFMKEAHAGAPFTMTGCVLEVNETSVLREAALAGAGIAMLPTYFVGGDLASGALVRLLPDHEPEPLGIHAVYLSRQHQPKPLKLLIDFLGQRFGDPVAPWDQLQTPARPITPSTA